MKITVTVHKSILGKVNRIRATNSYIDDILMDETVMPATVVVRHLKEFGLIAKALEPMGGGAALRLKLQKYRTGVLTFRRGNKILEMGTNVRSGELFSMYGKLVGHYSIRGGCIRYEVTPSDEQKRRTGVTK